MGFKKMGHSLYFTDFALSSSQEANRSVKLMEKIDAAINWSRVDAVLMQYYTVDTSQEGAKAYPSILLFKCLLLQKWFRPSCMIVEFNGANIPSDPEPENQINDRLSFNTFLGLSGIRNVGEHEPYRGHKAKMAELIDSLSS